MGAEAVIIKEILIGGEEERELEQALEEVERGEVVSEEELREALREEQ